MTKVVPKGLQRKLQQNESAAFSRHESLPLKETQSELVLLEPAIWTLHRNHEVDLLPDCEGLVILR